MLDLKFIRENPDQVARGIEAKGASADLQSLLDFDQERRILLKQSEELKAKRNAASDEIAKLKRQGNPVEAIISEMKTAAQKIADFDTKVGELSENIDKIALSIPNMPLQDVPVCKGAEGNKIVRAWGEPRKLGFKTKDHLELANELGLFSMEKGSKITGGGSPSILGQVPGLKGP